MVPQSILDGYHQSLGADFLGLPKMPRELAETRIVELQTELSALDTEADNYQNRSGTLANEIAETQEIIDTQSYTEDETEILYWNTYRTGLRQYILNLGQ